ncbi:hypothetical protein [Ferrovibrio sp.]|uniref:hypothetical protein n=1 Tax=Ferrovibrio sp. TaxID=1917215 RepID=UPI00311DA849
MPPIDGIGSYNAAAAQQFQPRAAQERDNGGQSIQQFLQDAAQQPGQSQGGVQTQTAGAVTQPSTAQQTRETRQPAANDSSSGVQTLSQFLQQQSNVGEAGSGQQPEAPRNSALSYSANGTANQGQSASNAGRQVSLSV